MFRKALRKLVKPSSKDKKPPQMREKAASSPPKNPSRKVLTAQGWKRLMMKKHRKP